jgi:hypothetical protein
MDVVIFQMVVMPVRVAVQTRMIMIGQEVQCIVRDLECAVREYGRQVYQEQYAGTCLHANRQRYKKERPPVFLGSLYFGIS